MTLNAGTRLGPYEIVALLGAGGMGEVYRALDTRLNREVAIKLLPDVVAQDVHLRERFEREARMIARLSHPHICSLFDIGQENGMAYLVMELVEGETLAERLQRGPLSLAQVIRYGSEIADALEAAHRKGIVHRDLKPGNVMLAKSGAKVLDFGLATVVRPEPVATRIDSMLPTADKPITEEGTILGTLHYMAPEQLEGRAADARSDIFALGATLYEMSTGRRAFPGKTKASLIASILAADPEPITKVEPMTPPAFERIVNACLEKDPEERFQSAHDLARELRWLQESAPARRARTNWRAVGFALAALAGVAITSAVFLMFAPQREMDTYRLAFRIPDGSKVLNFALSPDGKQVALVLRDAMSVRLWVHNLRSGELKLLERTDDATYPFWSPDSRTIAFFANGRLQRINSSGGPPQTISPAPGGRGGTWNRDGTILFSPRSNGPLFTVRAEGGDLRQVTTLDASRSESSHRWPHFLPDGEQFVYLRTSFGTEAQNPKNGLYLGSLAGKQERLVVAVNSNVAYADGHLLFVREGGLFAQPFDPDDGTLEGAPKMLVSEVSFWPQVYWGDFAISSAGVLLSKEGGGSGLQLVWTNENGAELDRLPTHGLIANPRISPDGTHVAYDLADPRTANGDVWIYDLSRAKAQRLTFGPAFDAVPLWSPDGREIIFGTYRGNEQLVCSRFSDGTGEEKCFPGPPLGPILPCDVSPDGKFIVGRGLTLTGGYDIHIADSSAARPLLHSSAAETDARISKDGRWLAYVSDETGEPEIYVTHFPTPTGRWQISVDGGIQPEWSRDGKRLFFLAPDKRLMAVDVVAGNSFDAGAPREVFQTRRGDRVSATDIFFYAVAADGRFLVLRDERGAQDSIDVFLNWNEGR